MNNGCRPDNRVKLKVIGSKGQFVIDQARYAVAIVRRSSILTKNYLLSEFSDLSFCSVRFDSA